MFYSYNTAPKLGKVFDLIYLKVNLILLQRFEEKNWFSIVMFYEDSKTPTYFCS